MRYRVKARQLYKAANSAANDEPRKQFTNLARQHEHMAAWMKEIGEYQAASD
jgi:hypothetical protein